MVLIGSPYRSDSTGGSATYHNKETDAEVESENSFDPEYENMSIEEFEPMVRNVFAKPKNSIYKRRDYA